MSLDRQISCFCTFFVLLLQMTTKQCSIQMAACSLCTSHMHMYPILYCVCLLLLIQLAVLQLYLHTILQASLSPRPPPSFSVAGEEPGNETATDLIEELCHQPDFLICLQLKVTKPLWQSLPCEPCCLRINDGCTQKTLQISAMYSQAVIDASIHIHCQHCDRIKNILVLCMDNVIDASAYIPCKNRDQEHILCMGNLACRQQEPGTLFVTG